MIDIIKEYKISEYVGNFALIKGNIEKETSTI